MDLTYKKPAVLEYIDATEGIGETFRRTMDESLAQYKSCQQKYSRLYSELEQVVHRAYNKVEAAESQVRRAEDQINYAMRMLEMADDDDDSLRDAAMAKLRAAQAQMAAAQLELNNAMQEYNEARARLKALTDIWARYQPLADSATKRIEDGISSFHTISDNGNSALGEYMEIMDKADNVLYGDGSYGSLSTSYYSGSGSGSSGLYGSAGSVAGGDASAISGNVTNAVGGGIAGAVSGALGGVNRGGAANVVGSIIGGSAGNATSSQYSRSFTSATGNLFAVAVAAGVSTLVMNIAGQNLTFENSRSGSARAYRTALQNGDEEMASLISRIFDCKNKKSSDQAIEKWNTEYMPMVRANISQAVADKFSDCILPEKMERCLNALEFMDQDELLYRYGGVPSGNGVITGFSDGVSVNVASDIKFSTTDSNVGNQSVYGSGDMKINFAFVTAVHEFLHSASANDSNGIKKRGIMVGNDERSRAMNEALTEYFTFIACGGEQPLNGLYPGEYSMYHKLMSFMPVIEEKVGRDCLKDAYFNNNPEAIRSKIDSILGEGSWGEMCSLAYDFQYNDNKYNCLNRLTEKLNCLKES